MIKIMGETIVASCEFLATKNYRYYVASVIIMIGVFLAVGISFGQNSSQPKRLEYVRSGNLFNGELPQGKEFIIFGTIGPHVKRVTVEAIKVDKKKAGELSKDEKSKFDKLKEDSSRHYVQRIWNRQADSTEEFEVSFPRLISNSYYAFRLTFVEKLDDKETEMLNKEIQLFVQDFIQTAISKGYIENQAVDDFLKTQENRLKEYKDENGETIQLDSKDLPLQTVFDSYSQIKTEKDNSAFISSLNDLEEELKTVGQLAQIIGKFLKSKYAAGFKINLGSDLVLDGKETGFTFEKFLKLVQNEIIFKPEGYQEFTEDKKRFENGKIVDCSPGETTNFFQLLKEVLAKFASEEITTDSNEPLFNDSEKKYLVKLRKTAVRIGKVKDRIRSLTEMVESTQPQLRSAISNVYVEKAVEKDASPAIPNHTDLARFYISADLGTTIIPTLYEVSSYVGLNFYLSSVDKDIPLWVEDGFRKRFSFMVGTNMSEIENVGDTLVGLLGSRKLLIGVGFRVTEYLRAGGGLLLFKQANPNPLVSTEKLKGTGYWSLSLDLDVAGTVREMFNNLTRQGGD